MPDSGVLVTGGNGILGRELVKLLEERTVPFLIASRTNPDSVGNWMHIDLATGEGLKEVTKNRKTIFHLASATGNYNSKVDIDGTRKLLQSAAENKVSHFIYISIVGIDKVPMKYYKYKLQAEKEIINSGIPYTILRATQFHELIDMMLNRFLKNRISFFPRNIKIQPIETKIVAWRLVVLGESVPENRIINLGGKDVMDFGHAARLWLSAQNKRKVMIGIPAIGERLRSLKKGGLTCAERSEESCTWEEWIARKYTSSS